jgi:hypothetical protein
VQNFWPVDNVSRELAVLPNYLGMAIGKELKRSGLTFKGARDGGFSHRFV